MEPKIQNGYEITCSGTFYAAADRNKVLRSWGPEVFFLPEYSVIKTGYEYVEKTIGGHKVKRAAPRTEKVNSLQWASHLIQRYYLPARLSEKHTDFVRFRTCIITNTRRVSREIDPSQDLREENIPNMTLEQLRTLCSIKAVALPLDSFADIAEARKAVLNELQNLKLAGKIANLEPQSAANDRPTENEEPETESFKEGSVTTAPVNDDDLFN